MKCSISVLCAIQVYRWVGTFMKPNYFSPDRLWISFNWNALNIIKNKPNPKINTFESFFNVNKSQYPVRVLTLLIFLSLQQRKQHFDKDWEQTVCWADSTDQIEGKLDRLAAVCKCTDTGHINKGPEVWYRKNRAPLITNNAPFWTNASTLPGIQSLGTYHTTSFTLEWAGTQV